MAVESSTKQDYLQELPQTTEKLNIVVLMGGPSSEREISMLSGEAIAAALAGKGHNIERCDISPEDVSALEKPNIDVVFIALHGEFGESGEVQRLCEARGLKYTGSGPRASELAIDKAAAKQIFKRHGLDTPDWMVIEEFHSPDDVAQWVREIPPPVVLKPVDGGSSLDISTARDEQQRDELLGLLLDKYSRAMIERHVDGREITVGILGEKALPVIEIIPPGEFYDYEAKYEDTRTQYIAEHGLDENTTNAIQSAALTAHHALDCRDMSRVDFVLDKEGTAQLLEVNTIPGFTSHSLLPKAAAQVGISFEQLVDAIAAMAMKR